MMRQRERLHIELILPKPISVVLFLDQTVFKVPSRIWTKPIPRSERYRLDITCAVYPSYAEANHEKRASFT